MSEASFLRVKQRKDSSEKDRFLLMNLIENTFKEPQILDISTELEKLAFAFMSFKDWGPTPIAHYDMDFVDENPNMLLGKVGIFFMTLLGQGDECYEGLYGPLPVHGYEDNLAYLYAFFVYDESLTDTRTDNQAYSIFVMFFPRRMSSYIQSAHRIIGRILFQKLHEIKNIKQLKVALLKDIKDQLKFSIYYWHLLSLRAF